VILAPPLEPFSFPFPQCVPPPAVAAAAAARRSTGSLLFN